MYSAHIIVVSTTCFKAENRNEIDKTGLQLINVLNSSGQFRVEPVKYVGDDRKQIADAIIDITNYGRAENRSNLIVVSGGTGFSQDDITPEAVRPLLEKEAPGLVHKMMSNSLEVTDMAAMSRPVAGIIGNCIVVTIPGSPKGATENLIAILNVLPHGLELLMGNSRDIHAGKISDQPQPGNDSDTHKYKSHDHNNDSEETHSHHQYHQHHHDQHIHNDKYSHMAHGPTFHNLVSNPINAPVSQRYRSSPYPMISVEEAVNIILNNTPENQKTESVPLNDLVPKSVVAEEIVAKINIPSFRASIVDGYAVFHNECPGDFQVMHVVHTAGPTDLILSSSTAVRVTTGAPVPTNCTAVIPVEETVLLSENDKGEETTIKILAQDVKENDNIRAIGSDTKQGEVIISKGHEIGPTGAEIGLCSSVCLKDIRVFTAPCIAVMSTGNEVTDPTDTLATESSIFDANRPALLRALKSENFQVRDEGILNDDADVIAQKIQNLLIENDDIDVLITTGGVSMGETDFLKSVIERKLHGTIHFGRVNMKPGKPTTFASILVKNRVKLIFCLPGNPASALVTYYLFVLPALNKLAHRQDNGRHYSLPVIYAELSEDVYLDKTRPEYQRAIISLDTNSSILKARVSGFQRSSHIGSLVGANALLKLPCALDSENNKLFKGTHVAALLFGSL